MEWKKILTLWLILVCEAILAQPKPERNLVFDSLATRWDEAIPLGNGWLGALIWQKGDQLRISLDRVDLWDDRPMPEIDQLKFNWVIEKVKLNQYDSVQKLGDEPYEKYAAPTKIPGAAIEFDLSKIGKVVSNTLDINTGLSSIKFTNGVVFNNYIHAVDQVGYFGFENLVLSKEMPIEIKVPNYNTGHAGTMGNSVEGIGLEKLGYSKGTIIKKSNSILYHQPTWNGNYYEVAVQWQNFPGNKIIGQWTITNNKPAVLPILNSKRKEPTHWPSHLKWWSDYWSRSYISLPDSILERQYYLEMYKFGCVTRANTPPISLQSVWTADNGNLPPWKGDFHHDLNTQLSYWPGYSGNHLDLTQGFTNWLWKVKEVNKKWTKKYFEAEGLNVPGVTTISGKEMGGWIQYSMSPTVSAWLAQHFYWQWKYSGDEKFLNTKCRYYFDEVETFLSNIRKPDPLSGKYKMPLSSSPEYHNNCIHAWFKDFSNHDLALVKSFYKNYAEVMSSSGNSHFRKILPDGDRYPSFDVNETGLTIAPGQDLDQSHRHHAHLMAIHPLGLLNMENEKEKEVILKSLRWSEKKGTGNWVGYSFSWAACIYARAYDAENAAGMLQKFATNFCSANSFHLNGDQKGGQYSSFTYRPFTLEGNFAFAQGVHEMLLQSHKNFIEIFPATPQSWKNVAFNTLRTEGAFLVSAKKENGVPTQVKIKSTVGGILRIKLPFKTFIEKGINRSNIQQDVDGIISIKTVSGQEIVFENGYE